MNEVPHATTEQLQVIKDSLPEKVACKTCHVSKPLSEFNISRTAINGRVKYCRECANKERRRRHRYSFERKSWSLQRKFNIDLEQYQALFKQQNGLCAICQKPEKVQSRMLSVDHDHKTGVIRGLLCHRCNLGIGYFKDDVSLLQAAAKYLSPKPSLVALSQDDDKLIG